MNLRFPVLVAAALAIATHSQLIASAWAQAQSPRDWPSPPSDPPQGGRGGSTFSLDTLFNALKIAPDEATAKAIEDRIWAIWISSGSDTCNLLMSRVKDATDDRDYDLAIKLLDAIVTIKPDYVEAWNRRATLRYISQFKRAVKHMPQLWGLHNYTDTNRFQNKSTKAVSKAVPGHIWLTETGGIVKFGKSFPNKHHSGEKRAAKALRYMFKLAGANHKIQRLYIFQWTGSSADARFDAGLMNKDGRKPRAAPTGPSPTARRKVAVLSSRSQIVPHEYSNRSLMMGKSWRTMSTLDSAEWAHWAN